MIAPRRVATMLVLATLTACAQRPAALDQAQTALRAARADKDVNTYAAAELDAAQTQLQSANAAWEGGDGYDEAAHRAELATREVEIARAAAEARKSQAEIANVGEQRDRVMRQSAEAQVAALRYELASLQAKQTERGIVLTVGDVLFDIGPGDAEAGSGKRNRSARRLPAGEPTAEGAHRGPHRQHRLDDDQSGAVATAGRGGRRNARRGGSRSRSHRRHRSRPGLPGREQCHGGRPTAESAGRGGDRERAGQLRPAADHVSARPADASGVGLHPSAVLPARIRPRPR